MVDKVPYSKIMRRMHGDINYIAEEAYRDGYDHCEKEMKKLAEKTYQGGLDDAWEAARKIVDMWDRIDNDELLAIFGITERIGYSTIIALFGKQTASEALEKLKAYEEKQKADGEIKVGDVVMIKQFKHPENHLFVVTKVSDESVWGVEGDGSWNYWAINEVTKTDKHYDIDKILEEMKK